MSIAKPLYGKIFHTAACTFIFRTNRWVSRCGPVSAHRPQYGKPAANPAEYDIPGVVPNHRTARGLCFPWQRFTPR